MIVGVLGVVRGQRYSQFVFDGMSLPDNDGEQVAPSTLNQGTDCEA